jgi:hypothetical protein
MHDLAIKCAKKRQNLSREFATSYIADGFVGDEKRLGRDGIQAIANGAVTNDATGRASQEHETRKAGKLHFLPTLSLNLAHFKPLTKCLVTQMYL